VLSKEEARQLRFWVANGYVILERAVESDVLDEAWAGYEAAIRDGTVPLPAEPARPNDPFPGRFQDPHMKVPALCSVMRHPNVMRWVKLLLGREPAPFQTITCHKGSQQGVHSDSIHMTTYPLGYLAAAWVAFEDIHPDSGPLVFYPGSHRWPYIFSQEVGIGETSFVNTDLAPTANSMNRASSRFLRSDRASRTIFSRKRGTP
jgi:hypothetical protein